MDWVKEVCGRTESQLLMEGIKNIQWKASPGKFETFTSQQLIPFLRKDEKEDFPLFIVMFRRSRRIKEEMFDTSELQRQCKGGEMFQVASNYNCQENGSEGTDFRSGHYLEELMTDCTQGPSAASGAGPGAIARWMQHLNSPINLLEDTSLKSRNGKLKLDLSCMASGLTSSPLGCTSGGGYPFGPLEKKSLENVKVGLQSQVAACFQRFPETKFFLDHPLIDQVFVSTFRVRDESTCPPHCFPLLEKAYEQTYLCAAKQKTETLFLTLIGGGVFHNPPEMIVKALVQAHLQFSKQTWLQRVILPLYDPQPPGLFLSLLQQAQIPNVQFIEID
jgi:hypothetical protein